MKGLLQSQVGKRFQSFSASNTLNRHQRTHRGDKLKYYFNLKLSIVF